MDKDAMTAPAADEGAWIEVSDALLAGITHDLNGRVAAVAGLLQVLVGETPHADALALLRREGERLDATVALLRTYPRGAERAPEAIDPRELLPQLLALHARRDDRQGAIARLEIAPAAPPARADRTWLGRALLVLIARAGRAGEAGGPVPFLMRADGSGDRALWLVRPEAPALPGAEAAATPATDRYLRTAEAFVARAGGELRVGSESWEVVLPAVTG
jgi:signal transduction histidine kinase